MRSGWLLITDLVSMPRKPTNEVIEHRITLGTYERQLVSDVAGAYQFNKISNPIVSLLSDNTAIALIIASVGIFLDRYLDPDWREITAGMDNSQIADWLETQNLVGAGIGGLIGLFFGGIPGAAAGAAGGSIIVEGVEYGLDEAGQLIMENQKPSTTTFIALQIYKLGEIFNVQ